MYDKNKKKEVKKTNIEKNCMKRNPFEKSWLPNIQWRNSTF